MRQVPVYGIIGRGLMGRHFAHYLSLLNIPFIHISGRHLLSNSQNINKLKTCRVVCLLIKDQFISTYYREILQPAGLATVHFSGALSVANCPSAHPLYVFSDMLYSRSQYQKIPFFVEEGAGRFEELLPCLPNPHYILSKDKKALYHSLCVLSSNFTSMLWQKVFNSFLQMGIDEKALMPFMEQNFLNLKKNPNCTLTGPLHRKDIKTIQTNLKALENDPYQLIYQAFVDMILTEGMKENENH